jgi:hypothetical protein
MMGEFLAAFPDLLITFDQFIAKDDFVVERYRQVERIRDRSATCSPLIARPLGLVSIYFALLAGVSLKSGQRLMPKAAGGS